MSEYNDVRFSSSTASSGGGGSAWGSRSATHNSAERHSFIDDHDRTPIQSNGLDIKKVCFISCSVMTLLTVFMLLIDFTGHGGSNNATNSTRNVTQLLSA
mgnify:CR=1 FL=1